MHGVTLKAVVLALGWSKEASLLMEEGLHVDLLSMWVSLDTEMVGQFLG